MVEHGHRRPDAEDDVYQHLDRGRPAAECPLAMDENPHLLVARTGQAPPLGEAPEPAAELRDRQAPVVETA